VLAGCHYQHKESVMGMVQLAGNGFGGVVQGNFGIYQVATDGTFTVDARDAPSMLTLGMAYTKQINTSYTLPLAPGAAAVGNIVASGALSNGTIAITANPDVMRPVNIEVGTGTLPITAGTIAVTYTGNDGTVGTDTFSAVCAASTAVTQGLSRGVSTISSIVASGVVGGVAPWRRMSTTAAVAVPVGANVIDVSFIREYDAGATIALGTPGVALGSIAPTTAPNGTVTYSFAYDYVSPVQ
jgi:hypothetical protein